MLFEKKNNWLAINIPTFALSKLTSTLHKLSDLRRMRVLVVILSGLYDPPIFRGFDRHWIISGNDSIVYKVTSRKLRVICN